LRLLTRTAHGGSPHESQRLCLKAPNMVSKSEPSNSAEEGKLAFEAGRYVSAAESFRAAANGYAALQDPGNTAEQKNNLSVALLKMGRAQEALDSALGTDEVFARLKDIRRQGIAVNNQAAALENLRRFDEALAAYERSARLLAQAGEGELRSLALKAAAAMQLRRGKVTESGMRMIGVLEAREHPSLFQRILKFLLRLMQR
jgi:tetratricopeptide (TPR) repeat protein